MGPQIPKSEFDIKNATPLRELISEVEESNNSNLDENELELLLSELRHRESRRAENIDRYRDLGFRIARTVVLVLGIILSALSFLVSEEILSISSITSLTIISSGITLLVAAYITGTIAPVFLGYIGDIGVDQADEKAHSLTDDTGSASESVRRPLVNSYAEVIGRNTTYLTYIRYVPVVSAQLLLLGTMMIGYGILSSI